MGPEGKLKLQVRDFGPIVEADIDLRPLTLFIGPSNTGKSYLAILIYALQRLRNLRAFRLAPHAQLDARKFRKASNSVREEFWSWVRTAATSDPDTGLTRGPLPDRVARLVRSVLRVGGDHFSDLAEEEFSRCFGVREATQLIRRPGRNLSKIVLQHFVEADHARERPFQHAFSFSKGTSASVVSTIPGNKPLYIDRKVIGASQGGMPLILMNPELFRGEPIDPARMPMNAVIGQLAEVAFPYIFGRNWNSPYYLPADRTGVMHAHQVVVSALVGRAANAAFRQESPLPTLSGVLADFLQRLITLERPRPFFENGDRGQREENLAENLEKDVLNGVVRMEPQPGLSYPAFFYRPEGWKDDLPLMRSSSMVSELAPVVLYLRHVVQVGDTLIIEEPEAHLHPAKQVEFMRSLAAMVRAGIRVIMTTHSEWVLEELANLVRASGLSGTDQQAVGVKGASLRPEDVGAWLFKHKQRPRGSVTQEISLTPDTGLYAAGFEDVAFELHNRGVKIDSLAGTDVAA